MHPREPETKTVAPASVVVNAPASLFGGPTSLGFAALLVANVSLAFGPWFVRLADTQAHVGPVAAGFWRITLAVPLLGLLAFGSARGRCGSGVAC